PTVQARPRPSPCEIRAPSMAATRCRNGTAPNGTWRNRRIMLLSALQKCIAGLREFTCELGSRVDQDRELRHLGLREDQIDGVAGRFGAGKSRGPVDLLVKHAANGFEPTQDGVPGRSGFPDADPVFRLQLRGLTGRLDRSDRRR